MYSSIIRWLNVPSGVYTISLSAALLSALLLPWVYRVLPSLSLALMAVLLVPCLIALFFTKERDLARVAKGFVLVYLHFALYAAPYLLGCLIFGNPFE